MARPASRARKIENVKTLAIPDGLKVEGEIKLKPLEDEREKGQRLREEFYSFVVKEVSVFVVGLMIVSTAAVWSFWTLWNSRSTPEDKQRAFATISSLLAGIVGFVFGKAAR